MTFRPLYCWSSSGHAVNWLCVSIIRIVVGKDWCTSILAKAVGNWRILILVIKTRDCSLGGPQKKIEKLNSAYKMQEESTVL